MPEKIVQQTINNLKGAKDLTKAAKDLGGMNKIKAAKDIAGAVKNLKNISETAPKIVEQFKLFFDGNESIAQIEEEIGEVPYYDDPNAQVVETNLVMTGSFYPIKESLDDIPEDLKGQATSLYIDSGVEFERELILSSILNEFENMYLHHWHDIIPQWQKYCIHENDEVTFHSNQKFYRGMFQGITDSGYAQIQINGKTETFSSGMVTL